MGEARASDLSTWSLVAPKRRNPPGEGTPGPVSAARRASSDLSAGATLSGQHSLALTCRPQWALVWAAPRPRPLTCQQETGKCPALQETHSERVSSSFCFQTVQVRCQSACHSSPLSDTCPKHAGPRSPPHTALGLPCTGRPPALGPRPGLS